MILSAKGLRKRYGGDPGVDAVICADLIVGAGEFVSIVGRSGSGKSTLLAMVGGLTAPTAGRVQLAGDEIWDLPEAQLADVRRERIGFVFQFPSLLPNLRAIDNVALPALLGNDVTPEYAYARAQGLLARVGLSDRTTTFPGQMSGGEQRRVVIARALINEPQLLLGDEPTSDLDEETEEEIFALLDNLRREENFAMALVTHNHALAQRADRMFEMRQGILLPCGEPRALVAAPIQRPEPTALKAPAPVGAAADGARDFEKLGKTLWAAAGRIFAAAALMFVLASAANYGVARYQQYELDAGRQRLAALEELATSTLQSDIASITRLGDSRYEVTIYLENTKAEHPIYVMSPSVQGFVQVGVGWQEAPLTPIDDATAAVLKVTGRQLYRFIFEARLTKFTELLPHYMHVRFSNTMLVSPESTPTNELFQRVDNYYVYLKPDNVDDATIAKDVRFPGPPPLWIWMPPH
ncbi:ABC transporter ATP-binding protein [Methylocystis hirsuta]|uniref:ABC transporter ATP-binding protein n=1 Tax=Methylocystis hirsuta TaxID=369798 RepID=A0A3M9XLX3_9HYPH|nr:ABC transporter ATP-binding protein [Methylocystis hirsuta]RNJ48835.1 ABC transporter ATP-binding protein [Methylocystis hirsuta]